MFGTWMKFHLLEEPFALATGGPLPLPCLSLSLSLSLPRASGFGPTQRTRLSGSPRSLAKDPTKLAFEWCGVGVVGVVGLATCKTLKQSREWFRFLVERTSCAPSSV